MKNNNNRSKHAQDRQQQRGITDTAVVIVRRYGRKIRQPKGRTAHFLGRKEVLANLALGVRLEAYMNNAVIDAADGTEVTFIKTADAKRLELWGRPKRSSRRPGR